VASNGIVDESSYTGDEMITVKGIFGPEEKIPTAVIEIRSRISSVLTILSV
jgi:hypothetical protein